MDVYARMTEDQCSKMRDVLDEIAFERELQHVKWGEQNHPDALLNTYGPSYAHNLMSAGEARTMCEIAARHGTCTYAHILIEEVAEAIEATEDQQELRAELVQVAAVAAAWIEAIDRRSR